MMLMRDEHIAFGWCGYAEDRAMRISLLFGCSSLAHRRTPAASKIPGRAYNQGHIETTF